MRCLSQKGGTSEKSSKATIFVNINQKDSFFAEAVLFAIVVDFKIKCSEENSGFANGHVLPVELSIPTEIAMPRLISTTKDWGFSPRNVQTKLGRGIVQ